MKELELFSTRLNKHLKDRVSVFSKKQGVTIQKFTEYAFEKTLSENKDIKSQATVFMENKLKEVKYKSDSKAHELVDELLRLIESNGIDLDREANEVYEDYKEAVIEENLALSFYEDTL